METQPLWANRVTGFDPEYPVEQVLANPVNFKIHSELQ